jgi:hypothetical protein
MFRRLEAILWLNWELYISKYLARTTSEACRCHAIHLTRH